MQIGPILLFTAFQRVLKAMREWGMRHGAWGMGHGAQAMPIRSI